MQWTLFLLILMGQCSFFTCRLYEYHFIEDEKTWEEAQAYCREEYTDLATVYNMTDMERLRDSTDEKHNAWIGLYNILGQEVKEQTWFQWLVELIKTVWHSGEPNDVDNNGNCVLKKKNLEGWLDVPCTDKYMFICYNETNKSGKKFHLINDTMSWPKAQNYCREHHTDLVSGLNQLNDIDLKEQIYSYDVWIGLLRDTWRWSDGSRFSFRNGDLKLFKDDDRKKCAMTKLDGTGKWDSDDCNNKKPFFCYEDEVILIQESKTWEEALNYCTENYRDLVSITNPHQQIWVQEKAKNASTSHVWLGLRYTCSLDLWFWVSDELVCYDNWNSSATTDNCYSAAAMDKGGQHKWLKKNYTETFNFICAL